MKKGLWIALSTLGLLLLIVAGAYFWLKNKAWNQVADLAAEKGYVLAKPDIIVRWQSGLHFRLEILDLKIQFKEPSPLRGVAEIPRLFLDLEYKRDENLLIVYDSEVEKLKISASFHSDTETKEEEPKEAPLEIPRVAFPEIELPEDFRLPVALDLRHLRLTSESAQIQMPAPNAVNFESQDLLLEASALANTEKIQSKIDLQIPLWSLKYKSYTQVAEIQKANLKLAFESQNTGEAFSILKSQVVLNSEWQKMEFHSLSEDPITQKTKELWVKDEGGQLQAKANSETAEFEISGRNFSSSLSKKSTAWSFSLKPIFQDQKQSRFELIASVPDALKLNAKIQTDNQMNLKKPNASVDGDLKVHPDLFSVLVDKIPFQLQGWLESKFSGKISSEEDIDLKIQLKAQGIDANLRAEASIPKKRGQSIGNLVLDLNKQKVQVEDKSFSGHLRLPFKLIWNEGERIYVETEAQFENFVIRSPKFNLYALSGKLPLTQSWRKHPGGWDLSPRLQMNAFGRVDFESFAPLEYGDYVIHIGRLQMEKKSWGPIDVQLRINQNLLRSAAWQIGLEQGRLEGAFLLDLKLDNPKLGIMTRAFGVHPGELLPQNVGRGAWLNQPLSFFMGMDWDISKAEAQGRMDWTNINSAQVLGILDILDPLYENKTYNQARTILASAYPTRVQVDMKGAFADLRIRTNVIDLPEVRDVPLSPYLLRANEALYSNEYYQKLRSLNE